MPAEMKEEMWEVAQVLISLIDIYYLNIDDSVYCICVYVRFIIHVLQTKFDIAERAKKWVFSKLSHSWRNWKCELKRKYYNPFPTVQEQLQQCPNRVNRRQWVSLVKFWGSHAGKV